uniref:Heterogeneous nuclear ribonucleoprotein Q acidic domain-containing protein n=1 Tax=Guillardia theta TaxID=55529 RepID=A0A7S4PPQ6_GUITH|mmetsp:Transcript_7530/g.25661  ORF Transcript_7530/g.25661 Transcript_7530/m.25661 type:complete len:442 (+) Transcript_7530:23-1348(+)
MSSNENKRKAESPTEEDEASAAKKPKASEEEGEKPDSTQEKDVNEQKSDETKSDQNGHTSIETDSKQEEAKGEITPAQEKPVESSSKLPEVLDSKPATKAKLEWLFSTGKCRRDELDSKIVASLCDFSDSVGVQIIEHFCDADMSTMRSKSAFLAGVIKRFRTEGAAVRVMHPMGMNVPAVPPPAYTGMVFQPSPMIPPAGLIPSVQQKLDALFASGKCARSDIDSRCMEQLRALPEQYALEVVQKFNEADLSSIHSRSGFFMGIIKRFREQVQASDPSLTSQTFLSLPYSVQAKVETMFQSNLVYRTDLDAKCFMELLALPEASALEVIEKFCEANLRDIRNKTAFFLGIVKRVKQSNPSFSYGMGMAQGNMGMSGGQPQGYGGMAGGFQSGMMGMGMVGYPQMQSNFGMPNMQYGGQGSVYDPSQEQSQYPYGGQTGYP